MSPPFVITFAISKFYYELDGALKMLSEEPVRIETSLTDTAWARVSADCAVVSKTSSDDTCSNLQIGAESSNTIAFF